MKNLYRNVALVVTLGFAAMLGAEPLASRHGLQSFPPAVCSDGNVITYVAAQHGYICSAIGGGAAGGVATVTGTAPIASACAGGTCTVSAPPGGTWDLGTLKIGGITAMSKPAGSVILNADQYKIGGTLVMAQSSAAMVDTVMTQGVAPTYSVNLTTEGTIDWLRLNDAFQYGCANKISRKAGGYGIIGCDAYTLIEQGTVLYQGVDAGVTFTAVASDTTDNITSGSGRFLGVQSGGFGGGWGWRVVINSAAGRQYVARVHWAELGILTSTCTAILPDGTTATTNATSNGTDVHYHIQKVTYSSAIPGSLSIACVVNTRASTTNIIDAAYVTVGVI